MESHVRYCTELLCISATSIKGMGPLWHRFIPYIKKIIYEHHYKKWQRTCTLFSLCIGLCNHWKGFHILQNWSHSCVYPNWSSTYFSFIVLKLRLVNMSRFFIKWSCLFNKSNKSFLPRSCIKPSIPLSDHIWSVLAYEVLPFDSSTHLIEPLLIILSIDLFFAKIRLLLLRKRGANK